MKTLTERSTPLILVIEDEQETLDEVAATLAAANISCRCCTRPDEAFSAASKTLPDLILCDVNLFGETGPETCDRIKQQPGLEDVPVIFLSASQTPDIIRRGNGSCGTYYVRKPISPNVLIGLIDTVVGAQPLAAREREPAVQA
jgi:CheY-like chemotaxis protein